MDRMAALKFAERMRDNLSYRLECASIVPARSYYEKQFDMLRYAIAAMREQETVTNRNELKWTSVKEGLPTHNSSVICRCENITIAGGATTIVGSYDAGFWFLQSSVGTQSFPNQEWQVTHWMPMPAPPKEGADHE